MDARLEKWVEVCRWPGDGGLDLVLESQRKPVIWIPTAETYRPGELIDPMGFRVEIGWNHDRFGMTRDTEKGMDRLRTELLKIGVGVIGRKVRIVPRMRDLFEE